MKVQTLHHQLEWHLFRFYKGDEIREDIVALLTLPERTSHAEICKAAINEFSSRRIGISKVVSVTIDGTVSMTGKKAGFVNLFTKEFGHTVIGFHCMIHEEALCAKAGLKALHDANSYQSCELHFCTDITRRTISGFTDGSRICE